MCRSTTSFSEVLQPNQQRTTFQQSHYTVWGGVQVTSVSFGSISPAPTSCGRSVHLRFELGDVLYRQSIHHNKVSSSACSTISSDIKSIHRGFEWNTSILIYHSACVMVQTRTCLGWGAPTNPPPNKLRLNCNGSSDEAKLLLLPPPDMFLASSFN